MGKNRKSRGKAVLGYLKTVGVCLLLVVMVPVWLIRGVHSRMRFRAQLMAAGVPKPAARSLSSRYKLSFTDLRKMAAKA